MAQVDAIFSADRKRGHKEVKTWGDLGLTGEWKNAPIVVYSRNKASGTYSFFNKKVLLKGKYKSSNHNMVGSSEVVSSVIKNKFAVGYSGIAYKKPGVALCPIKTKEGSAYYEPSEANALSGDYPLISGLVSPVPGVGLFRLRVWRHCRRKGNGGIFSNSCSKEARSCIPYSMVTA